MKQNPQNEISLQNVGPIEGKEFRQTKDVTTQEKS